MTLKYELKENDFFQMQLYFFKADKKLNKIIIKNIIIWSLIYAIIILTLFFNNQKIVAIIISISAFIGLIIHPFRVKRIYFKRIKNENIKYKSKFNKTISLECFEDYIRIVREESELKIKISEIEKIIETKQNYFVKFKFEVIIIPKSEIIEQSLIRNELLKLAEKQNVDFENQLNWKW